MKKVNEVLSPIRYIKDEFDADIAERVEDLAIAIAEEEPTAHVCNRLRYSCARLSEVEIEYFENFAADLAELWLSNYNREA